jgi:hypothetical protein
MQFAILDFHLQRCKTHLDTTKTHNTEIESYFVQYLLTRIVAEYETRIAILVQRRCSRMSDPHVKRFVQRSAKDAAKHFNIGDLAGILRRFGDDYKQAFQSSVGNTAAHVAWDNIYNNRQAVAHGGGAQMSFGDLTKNYTESLVVLDELITALCLRPHEIRDLK